MDVVDGPIRVFLSLRLYLLLSTVVVEVSESGRTSVTLGDATVSQDDLKLLEPPRWLNDTLLTFWCEYIQSGAAGDSNGEGKNSGVQTLQPNLTYFLLLSDDAKDVVRELDLGSKVG